MLIIRHFLDTLLLTPNPRPWNAKRTLVRRHFQFHRAWVNETRGLRSQGNPYPSILVLDSTARPPPPPPPPPPPLTLIRLFYPSPKRESWFRHITCADYRPALLSMSPSHPRDTYLPEFQIPLPQPFYSRTNGDEIETDVLLIVATSRLVRPGRPHDFSLFCSNLLRGSYRFSDRARLYSVENKYFLDVDWIEIINNLHHERNFYVCSLYYCAAQSEKSFSYKRLTFLFSGIRLLWRTFFQGNFQELISN